MFADLGSNDLRHLAGLIANGTLVAPFGETTLSREQLPITVKSELVSLAPAGFTPAQMARVVSLIADERDRCRAAEPRVELVATGPQGEKNARDTGIVVEQLFREARANVLIAGFAVYDGQAIFKTIADRIDAEPGLHVTVCLDVARRIGDLEPDAAIVDSFRRTFKNTHWAGSRLPELFYDPRSLSPDREQRAVLHAKTIVIDDQAALITSANPTPAAYERNIELGVVIRGGDIPRAIRRHISALIADGHLRKIM